jgi:hypothetical protein
VLIARTPWREQLASYFDTVRCLWTPSWFCLMYLVCFFSHICSHFVSCDTFCMIHLVFLIS